MAENKASNLKLFVIFLFLFGLYGLVHTPNLSSDYYHYHYYIAYSFFNNRLTYDLAPTDMHSYFIPTLDIFNYMIVKHLPTLPANFVLGAIPGIAYFFIWKIIFIALPEINNRLTILKAALIFLFGVTSFATITQVGSWRGDQNTAIFVLGALYFFLRSTQANTEKEYFKLIATSGIFIGIALALKLTCIYCFIPLLIINAIASFKRKSLLKTLSLFSLLAAVSFFLAAGYWMWVLYSHYGNPFFPMFNQIFHSPFAEYEMYGGVRSHIPTTIFKFIFLCYYFLSTHHSFTIAGPFRDAHLPIVFTAAIFGILIHYLKKNKLSNCQPVFLYLCLFYFVGFYCWVSAFSILRYLYPIQLLSGIVLYGCISHLCKNEKITIALFSLLLIASLCSMSKIKMLTNVGIVTHSRYNYIAPFPIPNDAIVLLTKNGFAFTASAYPKSVRLIGTNNAIISPGLNNLISSKAQSIIASHPGPIYVAYSTQLNSQQQTKKLLSNYQLSADFTQCGSFVDLEKYVMCPVHRKTKGASNE